MNRDCGFFISILLLIISVWLDYLNDNPIFNIMIVLTGIIAITETSKLGSHNTERQEDD